MGSTLEKGTMVKDQYGATGFVVEVRGNSVMTTIDPNVWYHMTKLSIVQ